MEIIQTADFDKSFRRLPPDIQHLYAVQEARFRANRQDPRLHVKRVRELPYALSFRITRRYRVFFYFQRPATAVFFDIDHRRDIYRRHRRPA